ncbi:MAG: DUF1622 domain-containing protein [Hyphomicrobiales bacterium]
MLEILEACLARMIAGLELTAAALLVLGFLVATGIWVRDTLVKHEPDARLHYRRALARTILIGLEVLVAATIIKTVTLIPTLESMGTLVAMVTIRTVISWTTSLEMNGRWPWQKPV